MPIGAGPQGGSLRPLVIPSQVAVGGSNSEARMILPVNKWRLCRAQGGILVSFRECNDWRCWDWLICWRNSRRQG